MVLASLLVIAIVLINLYMMGSNKSNSQDKEIKMIEETYNSGEDKTDSEYKESIVFENINTADTNPKEALPSNIKEIVENDANKGIVIKDKNENEWVWVEVPKTTVFTGLTIDTTKELTEQNYNEIRDKLINYAKEYRKEEYPDEWYAMDGSTLITENTENITEEQKKLKNGCGLTYYQYKANYQNILKYIYAYGGFWIGRYEAGIKGSTEDISKARTSHSDIVIGTSLEAISQKDAIPYNYVYCSEAQALANQMSPDNNYTSSLMFGIQWNLICKFLEMKSELTIADINSDSTIWGNYNNAKIENITVGKYAIHNDSLGAWTKIANSYVKPDSGNDYRTLLSTGISDYTKKMNIYDLAGNEWEWTLEKTSNDIYPCSHRGGSFYDLGSSRAVSYRDYNGVTYSGNAVSFRPVLCMN